MRIIWILFSLTLFLCTACNNEVTSIGQDLVDDVGAVEMVSYNITNTSTIRIDSFPTSMGETGMALSKLIAGHTNDPVSGQLTATPYFEIVPSGGTNITRLHSYDSLLFTAPYTGDIWGDTTVRQTFYVYQLESLPTLDKETDLIYNNASVPLKSTPLGVSRIVPRTDKLNKFYIRLDDSLGRQLFDMVLRKNPQISEPISFIKSFHGLALVADPANTCLIGFKPSTDSLGLELYFHDQTGKNYTYRFNKSSAYNKYTFNNFTNDASGTPYDVLTNHFQNLSFQQAKRPDAPLGQTVSQGLNGYLIKMQLPIVAASEKYRTIVKAEIELYSQQNVNLYYPACKTVNIYKSDRQNKILSSIKKADGSDLTGTLVEDANRPEDTRYVINITDYYNSLTTQSNANEMNYVIISIPLTEMNSSFNRLVIDEVPKLNVYYAKYEE